MTGVVVGTILVNYAIKSPSIHVARQNPTTPDEDLDIDHHLPRPGQEPMDEWQGMSQVTAAAVALGVAIAVGIAFLEFFRRLFDLLGSDFFEKFPLFPFTISAAFSFSWSRSAPASAGRSTAGPSRVSAGSPSTESSSARSARCRWARSATTSARW